MSPAGVSRAARFSSERLLAPPNLLRRAAVALVVGVGMAELKPVPLVELVEEAEGATEGDSEPPTCIASHAMSWKVVMTAHLRAGKPSRK